MYFKRKAYNKLIEWKNLYSDKYAVLLEGARRVGKSTIAENFAKNEYKSYILIDFSKITSKILTGHYCVRLIRFELSARMRSKVIRVRKNVLFSQYMLTYSPRKVEC